MKKTKLTEMNDHEITSKSGGASVRKQMQGKAEFDVAEVLRGWKMERRSWGAGHSIGKTGTIPTYGKWGIASPLVGSGFVIVFPSGWQEESPRFDYEIQAMAYIKEFFAAHTGCSITSDAGIIAKKAQIAK